MLTLKAQAFEYQLKTWLDEQWIVCPLVPHRFLSHTQLERVFGMLGRSKDLSYPSIFFIPCCSPISWIPWMLEVWNSWGRWLVTRVWREWRPSGSACRRQTPMLACGQGDYTYLVTSLLCANYYILWLFSVTLSFLLIWLSILLLLILVIYIYIDTYTHTNLVVNL